MGGPELTSEWFGNEDFEPEYWLAVAVPEGQLADDSRISTGSDRLVGFTRVSELKLVCSPDCPIAGSGRRQPADEHIYRAGDGRSANMRRRRAGRTRVKIAKSQRRWHGRGGLR